tara:strand:- start:80 stop:487 length:408 start_codon:yes stop_codon:yes gene_type:complete
MTEIYVFLFSILFWGIIYQLFIIPRTAQASFREWKKKLNNDPDLLIEICSPLLAEIEEMIGTNFQSFWGSVSGLGKRAENLDPNNKMKKAMAKGDLYGVLAEYIGNKAGIGPLQDLIKAETKPKESINEGKVGPL